MTKKIVNKINDLLWEYDISLRELSRMTDIRHAALSEHANQKRQGINYGHVERIAYELSIDDIRNIIDLEEQHDHQVDDDKK